MIETLMTDQLPDAQRIKIPPVMMIDVRSSTDIVQARNIARRAASLLNFNTASRAQLAGAVASLISIILNAGQQQIVHIHGIKQGGQVGLMVRCDAAWLALNNLENASVALKSKIGAMMDEVRVIAGDPPSIEMVLWRTPERTLPAKPIRY
ncbi:MAG: hypothetical protein CUN55_09915 [Phototrophicales bacterium]|nr:MAG: hypothetical protein CUN55_09915 [Phototrophicales bacterium]